MVKDHLLSLVFGLTAEIEKGFFHIMDKTEKITFVNNSQHLFISCEKSTQMRTFVRITNSISLAHNFVISYFVTGSSKVLLFHFLFIVFPVAKKLIVKWKRVIARQLPFCDYMKTLFAHAAEGIYIRNPVMFLIPAFFPPSFPRYPQILSNQKLFTNVFYKPSCSFTSRIIHPKTCRWPLHA